MNHNTSASTQEHYTDFEVMCDFAIMDNVNLMIPPLIRFLQVSPIEEVGESNPMLMVFSRNVEI